MLDGATIRRFKLLRSFGRLWRASHRVLSSVRSFSVGESPSLLDFSYREIVRVVTVMELGD